MKLTTKSQQATQYLRNAISSGRWAPGEALTSERELMDELGVSRTTIRDALNALATEGVVTRKHGSGTFVSKAPCANTIAIVSKYSTLTSPAGYFFRRMTEAYADLIEKSGHRMLTIVGQGDTAAEFMSSVNLFDEPVLKDIVGIINLAAVDFGPVEDKLNQAGVHLVSIDHAIPTSRNCVCMDVACMISLVVEALKVYGHEDFVLMETEYTEKMLRNPKYRELLRLQNEAVGGVAERIIRVKESPNFDDAYRAFKDWWATAKHPAAVFFFEDEICDVACRAILELGIKVPEELAIVTDLNVGRNIQFPVPLTGIGWDPMVLVEKTWHMLETLMAGKSLEYPVISVPPVIREGRSLGESEEASTIYDLITAVVANSK